MAESARLNSMDLLPTEAEDDVVWVCQELAGRNRTRLEIFQEFSERLIEKGIKPLSRSAFYRAAADKAGAQMRMQRSREMFKGIASQFTAEDVDENTIILGEFIKTLIIELVHASAGDGVSTKGAMELARAFQATVAAQKISTDRRQKLQAEFNTRAEKVIERAAVEGGLSADTIAQLRRDFLGVRPKPPEGQDAART